MTQEMLRNERSSSYLTRIELNGTCWWLVCSLGCCNVGICLRLTLGGVIDDHWLDTVMGGIIIVYLQISVQIKYALFFS